MNRQLKMQVGEESADIVGDFFYDIYFKNLKPLNKLPEIVVRDCVQSNDRLSMLIYDNKMVACVIERRTEFNHLEFTLIEV